MKRQPSPQYNSDSFNNEKWAEDVFKYLSPGKICDDGCLGGTFSITAANDTFESTGLTLTLPVEGLYILFAHAHAHIKMGSNDDGSISTAIYSGSSIISDSENMIIESHETDEHGGSSGMSICYLNTAKNTVISLYAKSNTAAAFATRDLSCDDKGRTRLSYMYYGKLEDA